MRLVGGISRGIPLIVPKKGSRPTSDKVREALFLFGDNIPDSNCMDLFAGSGSLGLEALSRGAASCLFVDMSRESSITIEKNLNKTRLQTAKLKGKK